MKKTQYIRNMPFTFLKEERIENVKLYKKLDLGAIIISRYQRQY